MKLYRVSYKSKTDGHTGYTWHTSEQAAKSSAYQFRKGDSDKNSKVETVEFEPNRAGILKLLDKVATHPDNG